MRRVGEVITGTGPLKALVERARDLRALQAVLATRLGSDFSRYCQVAGLREDGTLVLVAGSPAWATRFRYLAPDLVTWARESRIPELQGMRAVHVSVSRGPLPGVVADPRPT